MTKHSPHISRRGVRRSVVAALLLAALGAVADQLRQSLRRSGSDAHPLSVLLAGCPVQPAASYPRRLRRSADALPCAPDSRRPVPRRRLLLVPPGRRHLRARRDPRVPRRRRNREQPQRRSRVRGLGQREPLRVLAHLPGGAGRTRRDRRAHRPGAHPSRSGPRPPDRGRRRARDRPVAPRAPDALYGHDGSTRHVDRLPSERRGEPRDAELPARNGAGDRRGIRQSTIPVPGIWTRCRSRRRSSSGGSRRGTGR